MQRKQIQNTTYSSEDVFIGRSCEWTTSDTRENKEEEAFGEIKRRNMMAARSTTMQFKQFLARPCYNIAWAEGGTPCVFFTWYVCSC